MKTLTTTLLLGLTALASAQQNLPKHEAMDYGRFLEGEHHVKAFEGSPKKRRS